MVVLTQDQFIFTMVNKININSFCLPGGTKDGHPPKC